ncbi:MAG: large conductance mechanosensitive channel protein MscL [Janthinobacterium lividum]
MKLITGFKDFILRGNVIDLAVAVVIGGAFTRVVTSIVDALIGPLIAAIGGQPSVGDALNIPLRRGAEIQGGAIVNATLSFLITAAVVYFVIVTPLNRLLKLRKEGAVAEPAAPSEDILLLTEIRDLLAHQRGDTTTLSAR